VESLTYHILSLNQYLVYSSVDLLKPLQWIAAYNRMEIELIVTLWIAPKEWCGLLVARGATRMWDCANL